MGHRRGTRRHPGRRRPHPQPRSHGDARHHRSCRGRTRLAVDAQLGQGRGGFYSYDAPENLVGCDIHSADRVAARMAGRQGRRPGQAPPGGGAASTVVERGPSARPARWRADGRSAAPYDCTWAFVVREQPDGTTRLLVRERYVYTQRWAGFLVEPVAVVAFVMSQRMLRGIRDPPNGLAGRRLETAAGIRSGWPRTWVLPTGLRAARRSPPTPRERSRSQIDPICAPLLIAAQSRRPPERRLRARRSRPVLVTIRDRASNTT